MNEKEIANLAAWTAKSIRDTVTQEGRALDGAGEDIIREYVRSCLVSWNRGEKISSETCAQAATDIFSRRRHETKTADETFNAIMVLGSKFPAFVEKNQRERDEEAARIAAVMPAVKV